MDYIFFALLQDILKMYGTHHTRNISQQTQNISS